MRNPLVSRLSSKGQVEGNVVRLRRLERFDAAFHAALSHTLDEWTSPEDERAFRDL